MKKLRRIVPAIISVFMAFTLAFSFACNVGDDGGGHTHTYESDWSNDADGHWKQANCGHNVKKDEGPHDYSGGDGVCLVCGWEATKTLTSISVTGGKREFKIGEAFSAAGVAVTATYARADGANPTEDVTSSATITAADYNANVAGEYTVNVSYTYQGTTKTTSYTVTVSGSVLEIDTKDVQKIFLKGVDEFTSEGLTAKLVTKTPANPAGTEQTVDYSDLTIDNGGFDKDVEGEYTVTVTYDKDADLGALTATYVVTVQQARAGIFVKLADEYEDKDTIVLDGSQTATIDTSWVEVYLTDAYGTPNSEKEQDYTAEVYKGQVKQETTTALGKGVYTIWVTKEYNGGTEIDDGESYTLEGFVVIYIVDNLTTLTYNNDGITEQQESSKDNISGTWTFTATYSSGATVDNVQCTAENKAAFTFEGLDTNTPGDSKTATVTYSVKNEKEETKSASCEVTYKITEKPVVSGSKTYSVTYDVDDNTADKAVPNWNITWAGDEEDDDHSVTVNYSALTTGKTTEKSTADGDKTCKAGVEFKADKNLIITVPSKVSDVTVTLWVSHTTNSDSGNRTAIFSGGTLSQAVEVTPTGSSLKLEKLEATGLGAGTYTLTTNNTTMVLFEIDITYTVNEGAPEPAYSSYELNPNDLLPLIDKPDGGGKYEIPSGLDNSIGSDVALSGTYNWGDNATVVSTGTKLKTGSNAASVSVKDVNNQDKSLKVYRLDLNKNDKITLTIGAEATLYVYARIASDGNTGRGLSLYVGSDLVSPAFNSTAETQNNFGSELTTTPALRQLEITAEMIAKGTTFELKPYSNTICIMYITVIYN